MPPALHVELAAQPEVVLGVQLVAQLVALAHAKLFGQGAGVLGPQVPVPLQVAEAVTVDPEHDCAWHIVEDR